VGRVKTSNMRIVELSNMSRVDTSNMSRANLSDMIIVESGNVGEVKFMSFQPECSSDGDEDTFVTSSN